jgi:RNA polymerase sigma factor (sigma-70 family)
MDYPSLSSLKDAGFEGWKQLSAVLAPKIRRAIERTLNTTNCPEAEDMVSEVFSWLVRKVNESAFNDMQHLKCRALIKAHDLAVEYIRRESKSPIIYTGDGSEVNTADYLDTSLIETLEDRDEWELAHLLLNWLRSEDPKQFGVLKCIVMEEKTYKETADELHIAFGTVGVYLFRGLEKMKNEINRHPGWKRTFQLKYPHLQLTLEITLLALLIK